MQIDRIRIQNQAVFRAVYAANNDVTVNMIISLDRPRVKKNSNQKKVFNLFSNKLNNKFLLKKRRLRQMSLHFGFGGKFENTENEFFRFSRSRLRSRGRCRSRWSSSHEARSRSETDFSGKLESSRLYFERLRGSGRKLLLRNWSKFEFWRQKI